MLSRVVTTEGRERLRRWIDETETSLAELGRRMDISGAAISYWLSGTSRPEPQYRLALERLTGIPWRSWFTEEERAMASGSDDIPNNPATGTD